MVNTRGLCADDLWSIAGALVGANLSSRPSLAVGGLAGGALRDRFGRLFGLSLCPGSRSRFLAEPDAVLAFSGEGGARGRCSVYIDRGSRIRNPVSIC